MHRNTPRRLMSTIRSQSFSARSAVAVIGCSTPALLKAKSRRPNVSTARSRAAFTSPARDTSHLTASAPPRHAPPAGEPPPAGLLDHAGRVLVALLRNIGGDHAGALVCERQRRGAA